MADSDEAVQKSWRDWALKAFENFDEDYTKFQNYYEGDHELAFATDRWKDVFGDTFEQFSDNWCGVVVDSLAQRLEITGFRGGGDGNESKTNVDAAEEMWEREVLSIEEEDLTTQTLVKGDGYLIVWPNPEQQGEVQVFFNDARDTNVYYDPANKRRILRGCKRYFDEHGVQFLYIYYPDRVEHWKATNQINPFFVVQMEEDLDRNTAPQGWELVDEPLKNPFERVPMFHFRNKMTASTHGISELQQVIPLQNMVNKILMDMVITSEYSGFPQKWIAGGGHPKDGWKAGAERIWASNDPNAKFGEFRQADMAPFVNVVEMAIGQLAKITQTPLHYLRSSGDMPSGEALKTSESGLIRKAYNRQKVFGATWAEAITFAVAMERGEGTRLVTPKKRLQPVWKSPETRHDLEQAQTAQLKSILGVPLKQLWSEHFGYTEEEISDFEKENKAVAASVLAAVVAQIGMLPPGAEMLTGLTPQQIISTIKQLQLDGSGGAPIPGDNNGQNPSSAASLTQILALLPKSATAQTTAGEATGKPQPNTTPPASPTRRSRGFRD